MNKLVKLYKTYKEFDYYYISINGNNYTVYKGYNDRGTQLGKTNSLDNSLALIKSNVSGSIYKIDIEDK